MLIRCALPSLPTTHRQVPKCRGATPSLQATLTPATPRTCELLWGRRRREGGTVKATALEARRLLPATGSFSLPPQLPYTPAACQALLPPCPPAVSVPAACPSQHSIPLCLPAQLCGF